MTSVFRTPENQYLVCIKGADSTVLPLCSSDNEEIMRQTVQFTDSYAREGLRTLVFAHKVLSETEYQDWNSSYLAASLDLSNEKYKRMDEVAAILESDFQLIGSTAIEDRLQHGVPEAISHMREAGIKIWVLTGDKLETAINIGYSSSLLDSTQKICIVDGTSNLVL